MKFLIRYINVGIANSILGLLTIFICLNLFDINYNISYFVGYFIGLINSFILNKLYTFQSEKKWTKEIIPFLIGFIVSYTISHLVLIYLIEKLFWNQNLAVIISMCVYTVIGFLLNKKIFKSGENNV